MMALLESRLLLFSCFNNLNPSLHDVNSAFQVTEEGKSKKSILHPCRRLPLNLIGQKLVPQLHLHTKEDGKFHLSPSRLLIGKRKSGLDGRVDT